MVAGKCQPSLGSISSRGCVSPCVGGYWCFTECLSRESGPDVCVYVPVHFLLQVTGEQRLWGLIRVGSSAEAVCQLESPAQGSAASAAASFSPSVTFGRREDVAESCISRSKHTAALKIRAKAFLYKHMVLFILLFSLSNTYLPLQSSFQPQGKQVSLGGKLGW